MLQLICIIPKKNESGPPPTERRWPRIRLPSFQQGDNDKRTKPSRARDPLDNGVPGHPRDVPSPSLPFRYLQTSAMRGQGVCGPGPLPPCRRTAVWPAPGPHAAQQRVRSADSLSRRASTGAAARSPRRPAAPRPRRGGRGGRRWQPRCCC